VLDLLEPIMRHFRRSIQWQCHRPRAGVVPDRAAFTPLAWCSTLIGPASTKSASTPSSFGIPGRTILLTSSAASKTSASAVKESPLRGLALNHGLGSLIGADVLETPPPLGHHKRASAQPRPPIPAPTMYLWRSIFPITAGKRGFKCRST
jgi:hypothetical protein